MPNHITLTSTMINTEIDTVRPLWMKMSDADKDTLYPAVITQDAEMYMKRDALVELCGSVDIIVKDKVVDDDKDKVVDDGGGGRQGQSRGDLEFMGDPEFYDVDDQNEYSSTSIKIDNYIWYSVPFESELLELYQAVPIASERSEWSKTLLFDDKLSYY